MAISGIVRGQNSHYARRKRNKVMAGLDEQFLSMGRWLTGSASDLWGRGPGFESDISHNEPDALQEHCDKVENLRQRGKPTPEAKNIFIKKCLSMAEQELQSLDFKKNLRFVKNMEPDQPVLQKPSHGQTLKIKDDNTSFGFSKAPSFARKLQVLQSLRTRALKFIWTATWRRSIQQLGTDDLQAYEYM